MRRCLEIEKENHQCQWLEELGDTDSHNRKTRRRSERRRRKNGRKRAKALRINLKSAPFLQRTDGWIVEKMPDVDWSSQIQKRALNIWLIDFRLGEIVERFSLRRQTTNTYRLVLTGDVPCCSIFLDGDGSGIVSQTKHPQRYVCDVEFVDNIRPQWNHSVKLGTRLPNCGGTINRVGKSLKEYIPRDRYDYISKTAEIIYLSNHSSSWIKNLVQDQLLQNRTSHFLGDAHRIPVPN